MSHHNTHIHLHIHIQVLRALLRARGDEVCGLDGKAMCVRVPTQYLEGFVAGDAVSPDSIPVFVGPKSLELHATQACLNRAMASLRYMGLQVLSHA